SLVYNPLGAEDLDVVAELFRAVDGFADLTQHHQVDARAIEVHLRKEGQERRKLCDLGIELPEISADLGNFLDLPRIAIVAAEGQDRVASHFAEAPPLDLASQPRGE